MCSIPPKRQLLLKLLLMMNDQFWTDFEDMQKIRKIWYYFRHETQNVKYVFLNTGSNKVIPL